MPRPQPPVSLRRPRPRRAWRGGFSGYLLPALGIFAPGLLSSGAAAAAPACPPPTLQQCVDRGFRGSVCGKAQGPYCDQLVEKEWAAQTAALPSVTREVPDSLGGGTRTVHAMPERPPLGSNFSGLKGQVSALVAANQILRRKPASSYSAAEKAHALALKRWDANGTRVESCQEYVHEKYLDFNEFEAKAGKLGADARQYVEAAFGAGGIVDRVLYGKGGTPIAPIFDEKKRLPRNAYFTFTPGPYPPGVTPYQFKSGAVTKVTNNAQAKASLSPADLKRLGTSPSLEKASNEKLDGLAKKQDAFRGLLVRRENIWAQYQKSSKGGAASPGLRQEVAADLRALDARLEAALDEAERDGCLEVSGLGACDGGPPVLQELVSATMDARRQEDLSRCLRLTANDFSGSSFVRNAVRLGIDRLRELDYSVSGEKLEEYLRIYAAHLADLGVPTEPSTGATRRGGSYADGGEFGDRSTFAAALTYGGGWDAEWGSRYCDAEVGVGADVGLSAWVFGNGGEFGRVEGRLATEDENVHLYVHARVLGNDFVPADTRTPARLDVTVANPVFWDGPIVEATSTFVVVFVPVTISGGISANIGAEFRVGGEVERNCRVDTVGLNVTGTINPYAGLSGFAAAAIGIPGLRVGIRGQVLVARVDLPLRGEIGIALASPHHPVTPSSLLLHLGLSLGLEQRYLEGRVSLFGELGPCPFCITGEATIVSWPGFGGPEISLFDESFQTPLTSL